MTDEFKFIIIKIYTATFNANSFENADYLLVSLAPRYLNKIAAETKYERNFLTRLTKSRER